MAVTGKLLTSKGYIWSANRDGWLSEVITVGEYPEEMTGWLLPTRNYGGDIVSQYANSSYRFNTWRVGITDSNHCIEIGKRSDPQFTLNDIEEEWGWGTVLHYNKTNEKIINALVEPPLFDIVGSTGNSVYNYSSYIYSGTRQPFVSGRIYGCKPCGYYEYYNGVIPLRTSDNDVLTKWQDISCPPPVDMVGCGDFASSDISGIYVYQKDITWVWVPEVLRYAKFDEILDADHECKSTVSECLHMLSEFTSQELTMTFHNIPITDYLGELNSDTYFTYYRTPCVMQNNNNNDPKYIIQSSTSYIIPVDENTHRHIVEVTSHYAMITSGSYNRDKCKRGVYTTSDIINYGHFYYTGIMIYKTDTWEYTSNGDEIERFSWYSENHYVHDFQLHDGFVCNNNSTCYIQIHTSLYEQNYHGSYYSYEKAPDRYNPLENMDFDSEETATITEYNTDPFYYYDRIYSETTKYHMHRPGFGYSESWSSDRFFDETIDKMKEYPACIYGGISANGPFAVWSGDWESTHTYVDGTSNNNNPCGIQLNVDHNDLPGSVLSWGYCGTCNATSQVWWGDGFGIHYCEPWHIGYDGYGNPTGLILESPVQPPHIGGYGFGPVYLWATM
jgi:hypothetical protein